MSSSSPHHRLEGRGDQAQVEFAPRPGELAARTELPVTLVKDTAAACVAELVAGRGRSVKSFLYVFVDTFIGGGLVLDGHLRAGLNVHRGRITNKAVAEALGYEMAAPEAVLNVA